MATIDRDLRANADRSQSIAEARLTAMDARLARAETMLAGGSGSARAVEEARAERDTAKAELSAAKSRLGMLDRAPLEADVAVTLRAPEDGIVRAVSAPSSTLVPAGAPLFELVGTGALVKNTMSSSAICVRFAPMPPLTSAPSPHHRRLRTPRPCR